MERPPPPGTEVDLGTLGTARISRLLGQGGEGWVLEVLRPSGPALALKWYKDHVVSDERYTAIRTLVEFGSPHTRFLWPISMASIQGHKSFGYVMPLREPRYLQFSYLLANKDEKGERLSVSFTAVITICRQLGFSFLRLHARGLCYRDISFGNVFFEPSSGDVLICDNDNVGIDNGTSRVLGTPFFMAPEVVRDTTYQTLPSTETDRHSLAVLLFYTLFMGHPLEGARTEQGLRDAPWLMENFGTDPVFCMHPHRTENRPPQIVQDYWALYPSFIRDLFQQAFITGLHQPSARVTEGQWIKAMDRLRDGMVRCPRCGTTGFWDHTEPDRACRACGSLLTPTYFLEIGRRRVAVSPFATVRTDHLMTGVDDSTVLGEVRTHPSDPQRWGLRNVSDQPWIAIFQGGHEVRYDPGSTVELVAGLRLRIGSTTLVVRKP